MGRTCCGGGPSPSSAMRLMYSWSILCPPAEGPLSPCCCCQSPERRALQSPVVWPIPPHAPHITLFVTLALSWHCHALWSVAPQLVHLAIPSSRKVPFNRASSLSCIFLSSLLPSGTSTPCWITVLVGIWLETKKKQMKWTWSSWRPCWRSLHQEQWHKRARVRPLLAKAARLFSQPERLPVLISISCLCRVILNQHKPFVMYQNFFHQSPFPLWHYPCPWWWSLRQCPSPCSSTCSLVVLTSFIIMSLHLLIIIVVFNLFVTILW